MIQSMSDAAELELQSNWKIMKCFPSKNISFYTVVCISTLSTYVFAKLIKIQYSSLSHARLFYLDKCNLTKLTETKDALLLSLVMS